MNDTLGHILGDEVLIEVGRRLRGCLRGSEVLARLGGDEFTVLIERVSGSRDAIEIADRIHATLTESGHPIALVPVAAILVASLRLSDANNGQDEKPRLRLRPLRATDPPILLALPALPPWRKTFTK